MGKKSRKNKNCKNGEEEKKKNTDEINIKIVIAGSDNPCIMKLNSNSSVSDIRQSIMERNDCYFRTCFAIYTNKNIRLDDSVEIATLKKEEETVVLKMVDKNYQLKDVLAHYQRFYNVVNYDMIREAVGSHGTSSLSFCSEIVGIPVECDIVKDSSEVISFNPESLEEFYPKLAVKNNKMVKSVKLSTFNPPCSFKKLDGDLLYIDLISLEGNFYGITAQPTGFYLNKSTRTKFDPEIKEGCGRHCTLDSLVSTLSVQYRKELNIFQTIHCQKTRIELQAVPYPVHYWLGYRFEPEENEIKFLEMFCNYGLSEETMCFSRDWNEDLQTVRELPSNTDEEKLTRCKYIYKLQADLMNVSIKTAMCVVDGRITSLNTCEDERQRMYWWNNLFIFMNSEHREISKEFGGEIGSHAALGLELHVLDYLNWRELTNVRFLGTNVFDYYGRRVGVQSVLPGIFSRTQEHSIDYGSADHGKTVVCHAGLEEIAKNIGEMLRIFPLIYKNEDGQEHTFYLSLESKGLVGCDGRKYFLDIYRLFPPDHTFLGADVALLEKDKSEIEMSFTTSIEFAAKRGYHFSRTYPHRMPTFRVELMKYLLKNENERKPLNELFQAFKDFELKEVSPDCFDKKMENNVNDKRKLAQLRMNARQISSILVCEHVLNFVGRIVGRLVDIVDGEALTKLMHQSGINVRYMGFILHLINEETVLVFVKWLGEMEMVCRAAKRILRSMLVRSLRFEASMVVCHFLNCFLSSHGDPLSCILETRRSGGGKHRKVSNVVLNPYKLVWDKLDPRTLWECIGRNIENTFGYKLKNGENIDQFLKNRNITRIAMLRRICQKMGIQVMCRNYMFESRKNACFEINDILAMYPVYKRPRTMVGEDILSRYEYIHQIINSIEESNKQFVHDEIVRLMAYYRSVAGMMNEENAMLHTFLASFYLHTCQFRRALFFQLKASVIFERLFGLDHYLVVLSYYNLGVICKGCELKGSAINCFYRVQYMLRIMFGHAHPLNKEIDKHFGSIFYESSQNGLARIYIDAVLVFLEKYDRLNVKGRSDAHQMRAVTYNAMGNVRMALAEEKVALNLLRTIYADDDSHVVNSLKLLKLYSLKNQQEKESSRKIEKMAENLQNIHFKKNGGNSS